MPDLSHETAHGGLVAGVDEVGRGPLAGPVVAAAVLFPAAVPASLAALLDDSKKLTRQARQRALLALRDSGAWIAVGAASVAEIDRINILHASLLAMRRAILRLPRRPDLALIDGNRLPADPPCPMHPLVDGDALSLSIAAASIVAKQLRDALMGRLDQRWPGYGWHRNAGYGTHHHRQALDRLGLTPHHRAGFAPVRAILLRRTDDFAAGQDGQTPAPVR